MKIFVTGASGYIGSAVVRELLGAGHSVVGLARSDESAAALKSAGVEIYRGDLNDLDGLRKAASASDGVIHLAFDHAGMRSGNWAAAAAGDLRAIETIGAALEGTDKPLAIASGTMTIASLGRI